MHDGNPRVYITRKSSVDSNEGVSEYSRIVGFKYGLGGCSSTNPVPLLPELMSPQEVAVKTEQLRGLRALIALATVFGGVEPLVAEERAILAELKVAARNRIGTAMDEFPITARVAGQNVRLLTHDSCPHASEIIPGLFVASRPFAKMDVNGVYCTNLSPGMMPPPDVAQQQPERATGLLLLQEFVAQVKSPVCVISLCTDWELSDEQGMSQLWWGGCAAVTGSTIFPPGSQVERISVGVGLGDHGAYDPRTGKLIDFVEILRVVDLAQQYLNAKYALLVHCFSGIERSVMLSIILLMLRNHMSLTAASQLIQERRSIAKGLLEFSESIQAILGRALIYALANDHAIWSDFLRRYGNTDMVSQVGNEFKMLQSLLPHIRRMSASEVDALGYDIAVIKDKMKYSVQMHEKGIKFFMPLAAAVDDRRLVLLVMAGSADNKDSSGMEKDTVVVDLSLSESVGSSDSHRVEVTPIIVNLAL